MRRHVISVRFLRQAAAPPVAVASLLSASPLKLHLPLPTSHRAQLHHRPSNQGLPQAPPPRLREPPIPVILQGAHCAAHQGRTGKDTARKSQEEQDCHIMDPRDEPAGKAPDSVSNTVSPGYGHGRVDTGPSNTSASQRLYLGNLPRNGTL